MTNDVPATVAILNTNDDVVELLRVLLEQEGFIVISAHLDAIKRGEVDLEQFIRIHRPQCILYDVAPPYDRQWAFMNHMRALTVMSEIPFVLTSTNSLKVKEIVGTDARIYDIVGKPYDLDRILNAVKGAVGQTAG
jgi:DNA-binding response OmpR family regulator